MVLSADHRTSVPGWYTFALPLVGKIKLPLTHGIGEQTYYRWKRMYGGLGVPEIRRITQLEEENRKLKQLVGEQAMVIQAQREVLGKKGWPEGGREVVEVLLGRGMSERRACRYAGVCRATVRYAIRPEDPVNVLIRGELRRLSGRYRRYGTPRMTELVRREGYRVNHKRVERLWRLEGLPLVRKRSRKRKRSYCSGRGLKATRPNEVWSYDFIHDRTEYGQRLKWWSIGIVTCTTVNGRTARWDIERQLRWPWGSTQDVRD